MIRTKRIDRVARIRRIGLGSAFAALLPVLMTNCTVDANNTESGAGGGSSGSGEGGNSQVSIPTFLTVNLQTYNGNFLVADKGGGFELMAYSTQAKAWETFTLEDLNGGSLDSGDVVTLKGPGGEWVSADKGGGGAILVNAPWGKAWEQFHIVKVNGAGAIVEGDAFGLQTVLGGQFVSVINGGGGAVIANGPALKEWETLKFHIGGNGGSGTGVLEYLQSISGKMTIAGHHNREPTSEPAKWTDAVANATGLYPGLWSGDFLFSQNDISNRGALVIEAKKQWANGAIVQLMDHACPPTQGESCQWSGGIVSYLDNNQWTDLITDGGGLNQAWKKHLDGISPYLAELRDAGVQVLFRPHHEMNQGVFWWGGRTGPNGTSRLFQITHDYLTQTKGLNNLIWVWDVQDLSWDFDSYNPGSAYWDILALDIYDDASGYSIEKYNAMLAIAGNKPMAIGECQRLPTSAQLAAQPRWSFFMGWAELVFDPNHNSAQQINDLYHAPNVITLDQMPGWK